MKKKFFITIAAVFSFPFWAHASSHIYVYVPLVDLGGRFTAVDGDLGGYFNNLFDLALIIGSILAVLIIATAGLQYMTTDAVSGTTKAKDRISQAIMGILMLLAIWIFFNEVNPKILDLNFALSDFVVEEGGGGGGGEADAGGRGGEADAKDRDLSTFAESSPGLISKSCGRENEVSCDVVRNYCDRARYTEISIGERYLVECKTTAYCVENIEKENSCASYYEGVAEELGYTTYQNTCGLTDVCLISEANAIANVYKAYVETEDPDDSSEKIIITGYSSVGSCNLVFDDTTSCKEAEGTFWFNWVRQPHLYTIRLFTLP